MSDFYNQGPVRLINADALHGLASLPEGSAQCCVTSPPYWGLRDYGLPPTSWPEVTFTPMAGLPPVTVPAWSGCLGLEPEPMAFVAHLVHVFREVRRVLAEDGTLWLNLGDSYAGPGGGGQGKYGSMSDRSIAQPGVRDRIRSKRASGLKPKDLIGIPWRAAFALQADGWYLRSDCIWAKPNPMPESVTDRPTKAHEYVFLLAKSERYAYDADAVREESAEPDRKRADRFGGNKYVEGVKHSDGSTFIGGTHRNARSVWPIATQPFKGAHFATMPPALAERCILAGSRPGDTVLDPFSGAGTTGLVSLRTGRRFVGTELSPEFCGLALARWREEFAIFLP